MEFSEIETFADFRKEPMFFPLPFLLNTLRNIPYPKLDHRCSFQGVVRVLSYVVKGQQVRQSAETTNKKLAEKIYGRMLVDLEEGRWFENRAKGETVKTMFEKYREEHTVNMDYYSKARDKSIFKNLFAFLGEDTALQDVETLIGGYEQHRRAKGAKPATIVKELSLLRRTFDIARKQWKWKIPNPVSEIEVPKASNERVRYLSAAEYRALLEALDKVTEGWLKPCVIIAVETGLRLGNICSLLWSEINFTGRLIIIDADKMKNADYIGIPLTERAYLTLKDIQPVRALSDHVFHDNGQKLYPVKIQRAFKKALKEAGITNFRFHDLRHCYCSYLRQQGVDLHTIAILAGHKDLRMTKRYAHLNVDNLREAVAKLEAVTNLSQAVETRVEQTV